MNKITKEHYESEQGEGDIYYYDITDKAAVIFGDIISRARLLIYNDSMNGKDVESRIEELVISIDNQFKKDATIPFEMGVYLDFINRKNVVANAWNKMQFRKYNIE